MTGPVQAVLRRAAWLLAACWLIAPVGAWIAHQRLGMALAPADWQTWMWVLAGAPWLEEWIFRSLLQQGLAQWLAPRWSAPRAAWLAALLSAAGFALAHAPAYGLAALWWGLPGLALAMLWRQGAGLPACVATHAWFNACLAGVSAWSLHG
ncbi:CPBP family glutamic-type intramembrane protease [Acidovorax lacteus]|uniref:CAAX prenyl protease 2/Lysostaphin resistance protein A-like domain-containing protein n=1 Tax=Acidovorax lacteus TaxID=1924988 RepID=A0ABP8LAG6_9BURK